MMRRGETGLSAWLTVTLRMCFVQQWFKLSDSGVGEALYESAGSTGADLLTDTLAILWD